MRFTPTGLEGAYIVDLEPRCDRRGFFARTWCEREFGEHGLEPRLVQCSMSYNTRRGTLRGMHYQVQPHEETKLVRCTAGVIYDVIVDLRLDSPTRFRHAVIELSSQNRRALYIPRGFAHGFQTLTDDCEVFYQMSEHFAPDYARGFRWNDPTFGIRWPIADPIIIERDSEYPDYVPAV